MSDMEMTTRNYKDLFSFKDFTLNTMVPKYFPDEEISTLNVGLLGLTTEQIGITTEDAFNTISVLVKEFFPNRASLPESIYTYAGIFQLNAYKGSAAECKFLLVFDEKKLVDIFNQYGTSYTESDGSGSVQTIYISKNTKIFVEDIVFSLDYDIELTRSTNVMHPTDPVYAAKYITTKFKNSISNITSPYIKIRRTYNEYFGLEIIAHQCVREVTETTIVDNTLVNYPIIDIPFTDTLAGFDVFYKSPTDESEYQIDTKVLNSLPQKEPFCYYSMADTNVLRITFSTADSYFRPEFNSNLRVVVYTTKGEKGNFGNYSGSSISIIGDTEEYEYNENLILAAKPVTESSGGSDALALEELRRLVVESFSTTNTLITDNDLECYFNNFALRYNNEIRFLKRRDDQAQRLYTGYLIMRNKDYIYPTNTLNADVNYLDWYNPTNQYMYMLYPGYVFKYKSESNNNVVPVFRDGVFNLKTHHNIVNESDTRDQFLYRDYLSWVEKVEHVPGSQIGGNPYSPTVDNPLPNESEQKGHSFRDFVKNHTVICPKCKYHLRFYGDPNVYPEIKWRDIGEWNDAEDGDAPTTHFRSTFQSLISRRFIRKKNDNPDDDIWGNYTFLTFDESLERGTYVGDDINEHGDYVSDGTPYDPTEEDSNKEYRYEFLCPICSVIPPYSIDDPRFLDENGNVDESKLYDENGIYIGTPNKYYVDQYETSYDADHDINAFHVLRDEMLEVKQYMKITRNDSESSGLSDFMLSVFDIEELDNLTSLTDEMTDSRNRFLFANPFLMSITRYPGFMSYYSTIIKQDSLVEFIDYNATSALQFILNQVRVRRYLTREKEYTVSAKILPSVNWDPETLIPGITGEDYTISRPKSMRHNFVRMFMVIMDGGKESCWVEMIPTGVENEDQINFEVKFKVNDHITNNNKVMIVDYTDEELGYYEDEWNALDIESEEESEEIDIIDEDEIEETPDPESLLWDESSTRGNFTFVENKDDHQIQINDVTIKIYILAKPFKEDAIKKTQNTRHDPTMFKAKDFEWTNVYDTSVETVDFIKPLNMVRSHLYYRDNTLVGVSPGDCFLYSVPFMKSSILTHYNLDGTIRTDESGLTTYYDLFNYFFEKYTKQYDNMDAVLSTTIRNASHIDMKFYNTYGRSKNYIIGDEDEVIDRVNMSILFHVYLVHGSDVIKAKDEIKSFIKEQIEKLNAFGSNDLNISNLMRKIEIQFPYVDHLKFGGFNGKVEDGKYYSEGIDNNGNYVTYGYNTDYQTIRNITTDLDELETEDRYYYVPEMLCINKDQIALLFFEM